jgi:hypothetical protein
VINSVFGSNIVIIFTTRLVFGLIFSVRDKVQHY